MIRKSYLPDDITLPCGTVLKPVIGGHLDGKPFLTEVDVTKNGWGTEAMSRDPDFFMRGEHKMIIRDAKKKGLKYRKLSVLSRNLRGKNDLHGRQYSPNVWIFVEVPKTNTDPQL